MTTHKVAISLEGFVSESGPQNVFIEVKQSEPSKNLRQPPLDFAVPTALTLFYRPVLCSSCSMEFRAHEGVFVELTSRNGDKRWRRVQDDELRGLFHLHKNTIALCTEHVPFCSECVAFERALDCAWPKQNPTVDYLAEVQAALASPIEGFIPAPEPEPAAESEPEVAVDTGDEELTVATPEEALPPHSVVVEMLHSQDQNAITTI